MLPILHTETQKANQTGSAMSVGGKISWFTQPGSLQAGGQVGAGGLMPRADEHENWPKMCNGIERPLQPPPVTECHAKLSVYDFARTVATNMSPGCNM